MSNSTEWPINALDTLWEKIQLSERQSDIVMRYNAGEKFVDLAKEYGVTPPAIRNEYLLGLSKLKAIEQWPHHHSFAKRDPR